MFRRPLRGAAQSRTHARQGGYAGQTLFRAVLAQLMTVPYGEYLYATAYVAHKPFPKMSTAGTGPP
jgi:hypothetical protein